MIGIGININEKRKNFLKMATDMLSTDSILTPPKAAPGTVGSFTRASASYLTDFEGDVRKVESGSVGVEGSRVVTNLLTYSEDLSNAAWAKAGTCTVTGTTLVNTPALGDSVKQTITTVPVGASVVYRVTLSGSGTVSLIASTGVTSALRITLTAAPTTYTLSFINDSATKIYWVSRRASTSDTATSVTVHSTQLENVTAQTITAPSEYIPTTTAAVSKCFSTTNANTVDANGAVTEATGTALPKVGDYPEWVAETAYAAGTRIQVAGWWYTASAGTSAASAPTWLTGKAGLVAVTDNDITWTLGGRLLQGYVSEPASTNKTTAYGLIPADTLGSELATGTLTIGQKYQITARTDADFTADGSADNVVGTQFIATAATVTLDAGDKVKRVQWGVGEKSFHNGFAFVNNITGLTLSGDVAAELSIVTDETEIAKAGLANINPGFKVYRLDNSAGSTTSNVIISGTTGNTNAHSLTTIGRASQSVFRLTNKNGGAGFYQYTAAYVRGGLNSVTPTNTTDGLGVYAIAGGVAYFLLPVLEEQPFSTSINPSLGAGSTRAATVLSYPVAGNIPTTGPWTMKLSFVPEGVSTTTTRYLWSSYTDADNYTALLYDGTTLTFRKRVAGTNYDATKALTIAPNTLYNAVIRRNTDGSLDLFCQAAKGTGTADTTTPVLSTAFQVGSSNSVSQFGGFVQSAAIYRKALSDSRCATLSQ